MGKLFSFRGRTRRLDFLKVTVGLYVLGYIVVVLIFMALRGLHADVPQKDMPSFVPRFEVPEPAAGVLLAVAFVALIALVWMNLALDVRRLHDIGISGWFVLLSFAIVKFVPDIPNSPDVVPSLGNMIWDVAMLLIPGRKGLTAYGEDPRRQSIPEVF